MNREAIFGRIQVHITLLLVVLAIQISSYIDLKNLYQRRIIFEAIFSYLDLITKINKITPQDAISSETAFNVLFNLTGGGHPGPEYRASVIEELSHYVNSTAIYHLQVRLPISINLCDLLIVQRSAAKKDEDDDAENLDTEFVILKSERCSLNPGAILPQSLFFDSQGSLSQIYWEYWVGKYIKISPILSVYLDQSFMLFRPCSEIMGCRSEPTMFHEDGAIHRSQLLQLPRGMKQLSVNAEELNIRIELAVDGDISDESTSDELIENAKRQFVDQAPSETFSAFEIAFSRDFMSTVNLAICFYLICMISMYADSLKKAKYSKFELPSMLQLKLKPYSFLTLVLLVTPVFTISAIGLTFLDIHRRPIIGGYIVNPIDLKFILGNFSMYQRYPKVLYRDNLPDWALSVAMFVFVIALLIAIKLTYTLIREIGSQQRMERLF